MTNGNTRPFLILNIPYVSQNDKFPSVSSEVGISPKTTIDFVSRTYNIQESSDINVHEDLYLRVLASETQTLDEWYDWWTEKVFRTHQKFK